jgi:predicted dehydrogenase
LNIPEPFKPGRGEKLYLTRADRTETIKIPGCELYIGEVEDMADAILLGKAPRISFADSRGNTAVILALIESAARGKPVLL